MQRKHNKNKGKRDKNTSDEKTDNKKKSGNNNNKKKRKKGNKPFNCSNCGPNNTHNSDKCYHLHPELRPKKSENFLMEKI